MEDPTPRGKSPAGALLAELRRQHGRVPQRELSTRAGFAPGYVGKVESDDPAHQIVPSREACERLAAALHLSSAEHERLQQAAGHLRPGERLAPPNRPSMETYLAGDPDLTAAQRRALLATYESLVRANRGRTT